MYFTDFDRLEAELAKSQGSALAAGSQRNLLTQCKSYFFFTSYFGLEPFPAPPVRLALFAQFLARSFKTVPAIQNYISGVRTAHIWLGYPCPDITHISIRLCIRGLQRLKPGIVRRAHPITPRMLLLMAHKVDRTDALQLACWSAILIGFFTFARQSNLVPRSSVDCFTIYIDSAIEEREKVAKRTTHKIITSLTPV